MFIIINNAIGDKYRLATYLIIFGKILLGLRLLDGDVKHSTGNAVSDIVTTVYRAQWVPKTSGDTL